MTRKLRICVIYDCLYPYTVGGHERWLRQLAESLADRGHEVTFLTRQQWPDGEPPVVQGVTVVAVSGRDELYGPDGNRRTIPPLRFGLGVFRHLARHRRAYDVVHTCGFPYFHLPALRLALAGRHLPIFVDWPEVWSVHYWLTYSGRLAGAIGVLVQWVCIRLTPTAVASSHTHGDRLRRWGLRRSPIRIGGLGPEPGPGVAHPAAQPPFALTLGRQIREKRVDLFLDALALLPDLRAVILGKGPEHEALAAQVARLGVGERVDLAGFVPRERVESELASAAVLVHPTEREGFGIVVLEAAQVGTPLVLLEGPDNAATELIEAGVNGELAADESPAAIAAAISRVLAAGGAMRQRTADWYAVNAPRLAASRAVDQLEDVYLIAVRTPAQV